MLDFKSPKPSKFDVVLLVLSVLCVVLFAAVLFESAAHAALPSSSMKRPHQQWEYRCMNRTVDVTKNANLLGEQGWEMVSAAALPASGQNLLAGDVKELTQRFADDKRALAALYASAQPLMVWCFKRPR